MKFKKLEVAGFKSFADRLEIKFSDGVTAIVGPNGCGKSNVADAIRWVLGEQSAKLLRGNSMQDVIFNGTDKRKSLSYCEVNLYFDNTGKQLFPSLDYDEVVISRKLYRSGESEYCINRTACRLKDITELLRDGGMGREGYSIIGQGRIEELLRAKPEDRRAIFEEAAGVSKFKARKVETERKLARTRESIERLDFMLTQQQEVLGPLSKQAEDAKIWRELRAQLKRHEINIYIHQYESASQAKQAIQDRLNAVCSDIDMRQKECDAASMEYNEAMNRLGDTDKLITSLRDELLALTIDIEKTAGDIKVLRERQSYLRSQNEKFEQQRDKLNMESEQLGVAIKAYEGRIEEIIAELSAANAEAEKYNEDYVTVANTIAQNEGEVENTHRTVVEALNRLSEIRANMASLTAEREALADSLGELESRLESCRERISAYEAQRASVKEENARFVAEKGALSSELDALYETNGNCVSQINTAAVKIDEISAKYYTAKTRRKMLSEMRQSLEGFQYAVKRLVSDAKTHKEIASKMEGVIATLVRAKEGYALAIDTALGAAVQNIVTATEEDAKYLIEYLKQNDIGRATFLPMSAAKPRSLEPQYKYLLSEKGVCGIATDLIEYDPKYDAVMSGLLGSTVITEDMDSAIAIARKSRYSFKIVTCDGEVLTPHGAITGGARKGSERSHIFDGERELSELTEQLKKMDSDLALLNKQRDEAVKVQRESSEKIRALTEKVHTLDLEIATRTESITQIEYSLNELNSELTDLEARKKAAGDRIAAITHDFDSIGELEEIANSEKDSASESSDQQRQQFDALRKRRDELHELMTSARSRVSELEVQKVSCEGELNRFRINLESVQYSLQADEKQYNENTEMINGLEEQISSATRESNDTDSVRVREIRENLANLDDYKSEVQLTLAALDSKRMELVNELQKLGEKKTREELQLQKVDTDIEQMQEKVKTDYNLDYESCLPFKEEEYDLNKGIIEANKINRKINALGFVDETAIERSQELLATYNENKLQRDDLVKAEADFTKLIADLSKKMIEQFSENFEKIRVNFVKIFNQLFGGGNADLLLLESEDPLAAGIEIVAQPPEKKLQSISLLSGGERALTAIAILFAILRLKPMPFCVLDEIEAALDDANAGRFAKYLRNFSADTQFIVITHRKPTMELADNLYGVTMEEKGVSKIVSVKLSEAIKLDSQDS